MGYNDNDLPPELHPDAFPELLLQEAGPLQQHNEEVKAEFKIMKNLDAAIRNQPKPFQFGPSAGRCLLCGDSKSTSFNALL